MSAPCCPQCKKAIAVPAKGAIAFCSACGFKFAKPVTAEPTLEFDGYRVVGTVGQGGMGELHRAETLDGKKTVAIKVIHAHLSQDPQLIKRFEREANCLATLKHPSIVSIISRGRTAQGQYYMVMEFVEGQSLRKVIAARTLSVPECVEVVETIAETLNYSHSHNILHRDIKPENVLVNKDASGLKVKVLDFGLAASLERGADEPELTAQGAIIGTPFYMSPEQRFDPRKVDGRTDIFALGVLFYELLTGGPPRGAYRLPSEINPEASPILDPIIEKMMATAPTARYQKVADVLEVLAKARETGVQRSKEEAEEARSAHSRRNPAGGSRKGSAPGATIAGAARASAGPSNTGRPIPRTMHASGTRVSTSATPAEPLVPVLSSLPSTSLQASLTVGGRCRSGSPVHLRVGSRTYQTTGSAQGHFSVMVDLEEGQNTLVAWSEMDGTRTAETSPHTVTFLPGGTRVSPTPARSLQEQRHQTVVHDPEPRPRPQTGARPPADDWAPSAPVLFGEKPEGDVSGGHQRPGADEGTGSRRVFLIALAVLAGLAIAGLIAASRGMP